MQMIIETQRELKKTYSVGRGSFWLCTFFYERLSIYWLINEHDIFELSVICVYQDDRIHTICFYGCVHFGFEQILVIHEVF